MNSISPTNVNFSGLTVKNRDLNRLKCLMLNSIRETKFIKNLSANQDVYLEFGDGLVPKGLTLEIPNKGHVNLKFNDSRFKAVCDAIPDDIEKIPQWAFDGMMTLSSKFSDKIKKAAAKCAEMNKTATGNKVYYVFTPERTFDVTPNLAISTKDIAIAEHTAGKRHITKVIDVYD